MLLHGSELRFSAFKLNFVPPCEDELWYATSSEAWSALRQDAESSRWNPKDHNFLNMLRHFWKNAPDYPLTSRSSSSSAEPLYKTDTMFPAFAFSRVSRMILYGILALAWDLRRRRDTRLLPFQPAARPRRGEDLSTVDLSTHVHNSFQEWISWWTSQTLSLSLKHVALTWRNCVCMFRLAHILYEIGSADLQIVAGRKTIEGRRVKHGEFLASTIRVKKMLQNDGALHSVLGASQPPRRRLTHKRRCVENHPRQSQCQVLAHRALSTLLLGIVSRVAGMLALWHVPRPWVNRNATSQWLRP